MVPTNTTEPTASNHPLSIEAIFPTGASSVAVGVYVYVTILCQSRLFFPLQIAPADIRLEDA